LLAENRTGYRNLCKLLTAGALGKPKGEAAVTWEQVAGHAEGLHVLSGGEESPVARALAATGPEAAKRLLERLAALFPGRLHVELSRHRLRAEEHANRALVELAARSGSPSSPRTASATRRRATRGSSTRSPRSATTRPSTGRGGSFMRTASGT